MSKTIESLMIEIAFERYERGELTRDQFVKVMKLAINTTAKTNGYAERFGIPFPDEDRDEP